MICAQNHDQVGNRAFGDRLPPEVRRLAAAVTLFAPQTPLLFMGEEHGEDAPFQFFTDHDDPFIADATREGRRKEFAEFAAFAHKDVPDPQARRPSSARSCGRRRATRRCARFYRELLALRRTLPREVETDVDERRRGAARAPRRRRARRRLRAQDGGARPRLMGVRQVWPGKPFPLGAMWDGHGTNFSLFSETAEGVELCLFDDDGRETAIELTERSVFNWHCYLPGVGPGQRYGYRVHGPYEPEAGKRFNPTKLLIDPYAKAIEGPIDYGAANVMPYVPDGEDADLYADDEDDAEAIPKCVVVDEHFDWEDDRPPQPALVGDRHLRAARQGLHEAQRAHPRGPARHVRRASPPSRRSSTCSSLGVTAVELLPIHHIADEEFLPSAGSRTTGATARSATSRRTRCTRRPAAAASRCASSRAWSRRCTAPGIEVILDVVYNHTAEGNHLGPMLSLTRHRQRVATTSSSPTTRASTWTTPARATASTRRTRRVLRLIMDSLRYFVGNCHVDGFRFDLASALAREFHEVDRLAAFFDIIHQDPILSQVKLIAEPWDVGEGGYQVGNFPVLWTEWNGIYRDVMRDFWRGQAKRRRLRLPLHRLGRPLRAGRPAAARVDQLHHRARRLHARATSSRTTTSTTRRTCEDNRDGTDDNRSWNCGAEGPTDDPGDQRAARTTAAELPRHAVALAGRADAARRRRDRAARRAATTTATARTTRSRGCTGSSTRRRSGCSSSRSG